MGTFRKAIITIMKCVVSKKNECSYKAHPDSNAWCQLSFSLENYFNSNSDSNHHNGNTQTKILKIA